MGPLAGVKILELAGLGPAPYCSMLLSDLGADVVRIDRVTPAPGGGPRVPPAFDLLNRGRRSLAVDLKNPQGLDLILRLVDNSDALIEGFRPGVAERLGLGPEVCRGRNPRLVYGRMTGWGQEGPLASAAGHDINYLAVTGALHAIGPAGGPPVVPLNLLADFAGGALFLALGVVSALLEATRSGQGQVVDAAMVDGAASLMTLTCGLQAAGLWQNKRGRNLLDGGAPFYGVYETKDGKYITIGAIEPPFYAELLKRIGLGEVDLPHQLDFTRWKELRQQLEATFKTKTREEWCKLLEGTDACFAPVLSLDEAPQHPHLAARKTFTEVEGINQPAPAPRFSRTEPTIQRPTVGPGADTDTILEELGLSKEEVAALRAEGIVGGG